MYESLWKNRDFVLLISGQMASKLGTAMTTFVIPWLFLQITKSGIQTGMAFAVGFVPYILISLPAGVWADRFNRKTLMVITDLGRLLLLSSIPLTHLITGMMSLYLLYMVQAGVSGLSAIFDASYGACLPSLVSSNQLREANNVMQTSLSLSKIVGPILGGAMVFWIGAADTVLIDVGSYIISMASIVAILKPFSAERREHTRTTFVEDLSAGITTIWAIKPVRYLMLFATLVNLVGPGMDVALLYRIQHELALRSDWAGIIMTGLSSGMLVGSLINRWVGKRLNMNRWLTISSILQVVPPIILSFTQSPMLICCVQIGIGILLVAWNAQSVTLRQTLIPNHLLGRCSSVFRLSAWVSIPVGDGLAGVIGQDFGTSTYFIMAACVLFIVAVIKVYVRLEDVIPSTKTTAVATRDVQ